MLANFMFGCKTSDQKLAKLIEKHPELLHKDTITVYDTTFVKGSTVDSIFTFTRDTVIVSDSIQAIKYFYNYETKHHYIKGEVKDRIVTKEIKVPYDRIINRGIAGSEIFGYGVVFFLFGLIVASMIIRACRRS
jgi:hypothetical protein